MGNCISKINKDHLFDYGEFIKIVIFFSNGITRLKLDMVNRGRYTGVHSITKLPEKITLAGEGRGAFFKNKLGV